MTQSIGGIDLILTASSATFSLPRILNRITDYWPESVIEPAHHGGCRSIEELVDCGDCGDLSEFFLYRDYSASESWDQEGCTDWNAGDMIHFLVRKSEDNPEQVEITMVLGEVTGELGRIVDAVRDELTTAPSESGGRQPARVISYAAKLRQVGCNLTPREFLNLLDSIRSELFPFWSVDELACHPAEAIEFCRSVNDRIGADLDDWVIMKGLLAHRKRKGA